MGIYLPNMEMPTKCSECLFAKLSPTGESLICNYMLSIVSWDERPSDCPLSYVPQHGRLIDANVALRKIREYLEEYGEVDVNGLHSEKWCAMAEAELVILDAPTIIPAEPSEEQREYEAQVEAAQYCEMYEPTYDPKTGAL